MPRLRPVAGQQHGEPDAQHRQRRKRILVVRRVMLVVLAVLVARDARRRLGEPARAKRTALRREILVDDQHPEALAHHRLAGE